MVDMATWRQSLEDALGRTPQSQDQEEMEEEEEVGVHITRILSDETRRRALTK
jgi:hypothetical protein